MNVLALKFKVGSTKPSAISSKERLYYRWLSSCIAGVSEDTVKVPGATTIPVPYKEMTQGGENILPAIRSHLVSLAGRTAFHALIVDIDTAGSVPLRARLLERIFQGIFDEVDGLRHDRPRLCIVTMEELPAEEDTIWVTLSKLYSIPEMKVVLVNESGNCHGFEGLQPDEIRYRRLKAKEDPTAAIKQKMIRQLGHFQKVDENHNICLRHFYDGHHCVAAIADYLWMELYNKVDRNCTILYHSTRSPWLKSALLSLSSALPSKLVSHDEHANISTTDRVIVVLDFLDSGKTLVDFLEKRSIRPTQIFSVLATKDNNSPVGRRVLKSQVLGPLHVDYIAEASYTKLGQTPCPYCSIGLPIDSLSSMSSFGQLRSIDFWTMVAASKLGTESDPPSSRNALPVSINSEHLIMENSGFIASRIFQLKEYFQFPADLTIVHAAKERGSSAFAYQLEKILSIDAQDIPRGVIDRFANSEAQLLPDDYSAEWYRSLVSPTIGDCLIVDDIAVTGSTLQGLSNLLLYLGKNVVAMIPLLYLGSGDRSRFNCPLIPLYEWNNSYA